MGNYVLGIDIGSGSVKVTLLSREGRTVADSGCEYPTYYDRPGWAEQDVGDWGKAFGAALQKIYQETGIPPKEIEALAIDAATHTAVLLDEDGKLLRRAILWTDQRCAGETEYLKAEYAALIRKLCKNEVTTVWTLPQLMWLHRHEPEVWSKIRPILFAKDYLRFLLTGIMETDSIDAMGSMFYDEEKKCWSETLCRIGEIPMEWLPEIREPAEMAVTVTARAAREYGLSEGTKVLIGTTDTVMEVFAAGNVKRGHSTVKLATAGRICTVSDRAVDSPYIFNYRHVIDGLWYPGTAASSCAASYRWYRDSLGEMPYERLNEAAEKISVGSDGLIFHPYLNGELTPYNDSRLKSSYIGISACHTKDHFTRATLEGVAFSLRDCMDTVKNLGMEMNRVRVIGGGAKGTLWRQIVADVLGVALEKLKTDDSSFGAAMLTAVGIGWFSGYEEAAAACVEIDSVTEPIAENRNIYEALFRKYRDIHDALQEIYQRDYLTARP